MTRPDKHDGADAGHSVRLGDAADGVGVSVTAAYARLEQVVAARHPGADLTQLKAVAAMAADCHRGQKRRSGDPYVTHSLIVATYVAEWGRSVSCIQAAVLHDVLEGGWHPPILRGSVDDRVVDLVELEGDLDRVGLPAVVDRSSDLADDAVIIKLADRLHNARTWRFVPPAKARRKADETIALYAPAAQRLGLLRVGAELNALAHSELAARRTRPAPPVTSLPVSAGSPSRMMLFGVDLLPVSERERYAEEWAADLAALHNPWERVVFRVGVVWSAWRIRRASARR